LLDDGNGEVIPSTVGFDEGIQPGAGFADVVGGGIVLMFASSLIDIGSSSNIAVSDFCIVAGNLIYNSARIIYVFFWHLYIIEFYFYID